MAEQPKEPIAALVEEPKAQPPLVRQVKQPKAQVAETQPEPPRPIVTVVRAFRDLEKQVRTDYEALQRAHAAKPATVAKLSAGDLQERGFDVAGAVAKLLWEAGNDERANVDARIADSLRGLADVQKRGDEEAAKRAAIATSATALNQTAELQAQSASEEKLTELRVGCLKEDFGYDPLCKTADDAEAKYETRNALAAVLKEVLEIYGFGKEVAEARDAKAASAALCQLVTQALQAVFALDAGHKETAKKLQAAADACEKEYLDALAKYRKAKTEELQHKKDRTEFNLCATSNTLPVLIETHAKVTADPAPSPDEGKRSDLAPVVRRLEQEQRQKQKQNGERPLGRLTEEMLDLAESNATAAEEDRKHIAGVVFAAAETAQTFELREVKRASIGVHLGGKGAAANLRVAQGQLKEQEAKLGENKSQQDKLAGGQLQKAKALGEERKALVTRKKEAEAQEEKCRAVAKDWQTQQKRVNAWLSQEFPCFDQDTRFQSPDDFRIRIAFDDEDTSAEKWAGKLRDRAARYADASLDMALRAAMPGTLAQVDPATQALREELAQLHRDVARLSRTNGTQGPPVPPRPPQ